jgi:FAD:protein FMN transferase
VLQATVAPVAAPRMTDAGEDFGFRFTAMACDCEVRVAGLGRRKAKPLADRAIAEVRRIESKYSRYRAGSVVSRINAAAGTGRPVQVDAESTELIAYAERLHELSGGLFDATSGILRQAWDFRAARKPAPGQLESLLSRIGWRQVLWTASPQGGRIELPLAGMELDFGGFGKEYAADRAATLLQQHGVRHGMVNLGGDIRVVGPQPDGTPWSLGIQHPREPGRVVASLPLVDGALATSGDYERYFVDDDGTRYCHVLDPRSGWPVSGWQSVSVVAPVCVAAGALTTIAMLKGAEALPFLDSQHVGYLAVDSAGRVHQRVVA